MPMSPTRSQNIPLSLIKCWHISFILTHIIQQDLQCNLIHLTIYLSYNKHNYDLLTSPAVHVCPSGQDIMLHKPVSPLTRGWHKHLIWLPGNIIKFHLMVQTMAWCRIGNKPLSGSIIASTKVPTFYRKHFQIHFHECIFCLYFQ